MRALNERLQKIQAEQAARQDALQRGRIRVEHSEPKKTGSPTDEKKQKTSA
jgi:hypothetical protein